jgi:glycosyltransferase involved in cell wall biosynthesis
MANLTTKQPLLSVVVPTYNRRELLRVTLNALAQQTLAFDQFEVLVISDGSSDGTHEMVGEYSEVAPYRLRLITQANAGPSRARNRGVQEAFGEVIVFMDDDLEPLPEFLAAHAVYHRHYPKVAVIGRTAPDPLRRKAEPPWLAWEHAMLEKQYKNFRSDIGAGPRPMHFYTGNSSVRRAHVLAVGGFDETLKRQEDVELAYRMERDCGVHFVFEAAAHGLHRPERGFSSWLNVPYSYGQADVVCARRGNIPWDKARDGYHARSRATRLLALVTLACPGATKPLHHLLLAGAKACYRLRLSRLSLGGLSVIYNLRYLEGVQAELGTRSDMRRLIIKT